MKDLFFLIFLLLAINISTSYSQDIKPTEDVKNQLSAGINISYILSPNDFFNYTPFRYAIGYKKRINTYRFKNGLEFNYVPYGKNTVSERHHYKDALLIRTGIERLFTTGTNNNFILGTDLIGFTKYYVNRTYGYGIDISSGWQYNITKSFSLSININVSIASIPNEAIPRRINGKMERELAVLINRLLFVTLDYNF